MKLDQLTIKAQDALQDAQALAQRRSQQRLEPEHLLLALLDQPDGLTAQLLEKAGVAQSRLRDLVEEALTRVPSVSGDTSTHLSDRLNRLLLSAEEEAKRLTDAYVSTEHLVLAAFKDEALASAFRQVGLRRESIEAALKALRGAHRVTDANPEGQYRALERYARDVTDLAR